MSGRPLWRSQLASLSDKIFTADDFGFSDSGVKKIDPNVIIGGVGDFGQGPEPTRAAWDAISGPDPEVSTHSLSLSGHNIDPAVNSAVIIGGRLSYYNWVGPTASLSYSIGSDSKNDHLAGICYAQHSDLMKGLADDGVTLKGDHGMVMGGSYHQVAGSYSCSVGGQVKQVFALQSVAIGGRNHLLGSTANVDAVRRCVTAGGLNLEIQNSEESCIIGGTDNYVGANSASVFGGKRNRAEGASSNITSSWDSKTTATRATVLSSSNAVGKVVNSVTRSAGMAVEAGDSQTHYIEIRRTATSTTAIFPSVTGGGGSELFEPDPDTVGMAAFDVVVQEQQSSTSNMGAWHIKFSFSNIGGTLSIKNSTIEEITNDAAFYTPSVTLTGGSTRLAIRIDAGVSGNYLCTGSGKIIETRVVV